LDWDAIIDQAILCTFKQNEVIVAQVRRKRRRGGEEEEEEEEEDLILIHRAILNVVCIKLALVRVVLN